MNPQGDKNKKEKEEKASAPPESSEGAQAKSDPEATTPQDIIVTTKSIAESMTRVRELIGQANEKTRRPITIKVVGTDKVFSFQDAKQVTIGRKDPTRDEAPDIDVTSLDLNIAGVSRKHCRFLYINGEWSIEDLGSRNGSWLNGKLLVANHPFKLRNGSQIRFGGITLMVELEKDDDAMGEQTNAQKPAILANQLKFTSPALGEDQDGLSPAYINDTLMPYLSALIDMAKHIDQAKKRPKREISIKSIQFAAPDVVVEITCNHEIFEFMTNQANANIKDPASSASSADPDIESGKKLAKQFASDNFPLIGSDQSTYYQQLLTPLLQTCLTSNLKIVAQT